MRNEHVFQITRGSRVTRKLVGQSGLARRRGKPGADLIGMECEKRNREAQPPPQTRVGPPRGVLSERGMVRGAGPRALGRVLSAPERAGVPSTSACGRPVAARSSPSLLPPRRGRQRAEPTRSPPARSAPAVTAAARGPHHWRRGAVGFGALRTGGPGSGEQLTAAPG